MRKPDKNAFVQKVASKDLDNLCLKDLFALKLEYIYLALGYSQLDFTLITNLNLKYFNDLIRGKKYISLRKIESICKALNIEPLELLNFKPLYDIKETKTFVTYPVYENIDIKYI